MELNRLAVIGCGAAAARKAFPKNRKTTPCKVDASAGKPARVSRLAIPGLTLMSREVVVRGWRQAPSSFSRRRFAP
jgi:hypothetical protein